VPLASDDRPTGSGEQVDPEHGEAKQSLRRQAFRLGLCSDAGELHPVRHSGAGGERWRGAGCAAGATVAETDVQGGRNAVRQDRRCSC